MSFLAVVLKLTELFQHQHLPVSAQDTVYLHFQLHLPYSDQKAAVLYFHPVQAVTQLHQV